MTPELWGDWSGEWEIYFISATHYDVINLKSGELFLDQSRTHLKNIDELKQIDCFEESSELSHGQHACRCDFYSVVLQSGCKCGGI